MSLLFYPSFFEDIIQKKHCNFSSDLADNDVSDISDNGNWNLVPSDIRYRELKNSYIYECEAAGIPRENIEISLDKKSRIITIRGKIDEKEYIESNYYSFGRNVDKSFRLPKNADITAIKSKLSDGIVRITVDKQLSKPEIQQIPIN